jgi:hypothetical protein
MPTSSVPGIDIRLASATGADDVLDAAHNQMVTLALADGTKGVLLSRHSRRHYTFTLSDLVPFGQTRERTAYGRQADNVLGNTASPGPQPICDGAIEQSQGPEVEK